MPSGGALGLYDVIFRSIRAGPDPRGIIVGMSTTLLDAASPPLDAPGSIGAVRLEGVARTFALARGSREVLRDIDIDIAAGEILSVIGPSGGGKSTLLRLVAGLDRATAGALTIDGVPIGANDPRFCSAPAWWPCARCRRWPGCRC